MPVIRVVKNKNYTTMSNCHLRDKSLSLKAKGLLSLCLSLPDDWHYSVSGLAAISKEGESGIKAALRELEENGYVRRIRERTREGRLGQNLYIIYEQPRKADAEGPAAEKPPVEKPPVEKPPVEKPPAAKPAAENPGQLNKEGTSTEESKTDLPDTDSNKVRSAEERPEERPEGKHHYGRYGNVLLSDSDYASLEKEFPWDYRRLIEDLSQYMASSGRTYRNHLATIRAWAERDRKKAAESGKSYSHLNYRYNEGESL